MKGKKTTLKERLAKLEHDKSYRQQLFKNLCSHVAGGLSLESFSEVSTRILKGYFERFPEEFDKEEFDVALQQGRDYWEKLGQRQANGSCLGNSRTWYYNMVNRFGWRERMEVEAEHKGAINVNIVSYASRKDSECSTEHD